MWVFQQTHATSSYVSHGRKTENNATFPYETTFLLRHHPKREPSTIDHQSILPQLQHHQSSTQECTSHNETSGKCSQVPPKHTHNTMKLRDIFPYFT